MNILELVNSVAVLGTTLLMMAVCIVWYSSTLFGKYIFQTQDSLKGEQPHGIALFAVTFAGYFVALEILGYLVVVAPLLSVSPFLISMFTTIFALALYTQMAVLHKKPLSYHFVNSGFIAVFIIGSTFVLQNWPW